jgi:hypothetical protein
MITFSSIINEVQVKPKKIFGLGTTHSVYQSHKNPDRLYKIGSRNAVEGWLELFKKYPQFFPKIYKAGRVTGLEEGQEGFFVEIERLETERVIQEWEILETAFRKIGVLDSIQTFDSIMYTQISQDIKEKLIAFNKNVYDLFIKWYQFIDNVDVIIKKEGKPYLDTHRGNFGYDQNGHLKCLDI